MRIALGTCLAVLLALAAALFAAGDLAWIRPGVWAWTAASLTSAATRRPGPASVRPTQRRPAPTATLIARAAAVHNLRDAHQEAVLQHHGDDVEHGGVVGRRRSLAGVQCGPPRHDFCVSGTVIRSRRLPCHASSPDDIRTRPCRTSTVASPGFSCSDSSARRPLQSASAATPSRGHHRQCARYDRQTPWPPA